MFTDSKNFVMKTLKEKEESLLFGADKLILPYFNHMMDAKDSLISKFSCVLQVKLGMMD
jgi:hypothetical protein